MKKKLINSIVASIIIVMLVAAFAGRKQRGDGYPGKEVAPHALTSSRQIDSCIGLLHSGDLLLRTGNDEISNMFRQMNQGDKTYSHSGIVIIRNGYPFVYHSIGGADNPNEKLRCDSVSRFIAEAHNLGFGIVRFNFTETERRRFCQLADSYFHAMPLFDMDFNINTDDKLYCSEFVYKAVLKATADSTYLPVTRRNGTVFIGVDNLFRNKHAQTICELRYK